MSERVSDERLREIISCRAWDGEAVSMAAELLELRGSVAKVRAMAVELTPRVGHWERSSEVARDLLAALPKEGT